jgi:hypothetical protein
MRRVLLVASALLSCGAAAAAQSAAQPIKVLLVTGGHGYEREPFLEVFRDDHGIAITHAEHSEGTADAFDRSDPASYDAVVLYDMPATITDAQKARFLSMLDRGVGLVVMHHALVSYQRWPDYERIVGGRYIDTPEKGGDPTATPSGYEHDVNFRVRVVGGHPITRDVSDFDINDEIYFGYRVAADVTPLATTPHPKSGNPLIWARTEGQSRVVYVLLGHGPAAYANPNYRRLVANSIRWAARRSS